MPRPGTKSSIRRAISAEDSTRLYLEQAGGDVVVAEPFELPRWDARRSMERLHSAEDKAGGLDGWRPAHWRLVNEEAAFWLAQVLQLVEAGRPWPRGALVAKAVLIRKPRAVWPDAHL